MWVVASVDWKVARQAVGMVGSLAGMSVQQLLETKEEQLIELSVALLVAIWVDERVVWVAEKTVVLQAAVR